MTTTLAVHVLPTAKRRTVMCMDTIPVIQTQELSCVDQVRQLFQLTSLLRSIFNTSLVSVQRNVHIIGVCVWYVFRRYEYQVQQHKQ